MRISKAELSFVIVIMAIILLNGCTDKRPEVHFGDQFTDAPFVEISELFKKPDDFLKKVIRIKGTIERQCPSAGCWFFVRGKEGSSLRVEMSDYFTKLPQNIGNEAIIEGEVIKKGKDIEFIGTRVSFFKKGGKQ